MKRYINIFTLWDNSNGDLFSTMIYSPLFLVIKYTTKFLLYNNTLINTLYRSLVYISS